MHRARRISFPIASLALALLLTGCGTLSYPEADRTAWPDGTATADVPAAADTPQGLEYGSASDPEPESAASARNEIREWSELTRLARIDRQRGDLESARDRLALAAGQLAQEPATSAPRRAVFGARARLARDFLAVGRPEQADALADELFSEVEAEPQLGGPATVELAYVFAERRAAEAEQAGQPDPQLRLLRIALLASESDSASQNRLNLAFEVSRAASRSGDHALARRAIDLALRDAKTVAPTDRNQLASLEIYKARIALDQADLATAEAAATAANRLFEEAGASSANRAIAEATLARALAASGDLERARAIASGAQARTEGAGAVQGHPARIVHAELARADVAAGDPEAARAHYRAALAIDEMSYEPDRFLLETLREELAALERTTTAIEPNAESGP